MRCHGVAGFVALIVVVVAATPARAQDTPLPVIGPDAMATYETSKIGMKSIRKAARRQYPRDKIRQQIYIDRVISETRQWMDAAASGPRTVAGGGFAANIRDIGFQVQIRYAPTVTNALAPGIDNPKFKRWETAHICGGTLIARDWVLTAAHCANQAQIDAGVEARLGVTDISGKGGIAIKVDRMVRHARYDPANIYQHDIALLHLVADKRRRDPRTMRVAPLYPIDGAPMAVSSSGWGRMNNERGDTVAILRRVNMMVTPPDQCAQMQGYEPAEINGKKVPRVHPGVICAGDVGVKTCRGDSGGPLFSRLDSRNFDTYLVGIVAWNKPGCGLQSDDRPGLYTSVPAYRDWITRAMAATGSEVE